MPMVAAVLAVLVALAQQPELHSVAVTAEAEAGEPVVALPEQIHLVRPVATAAIITIRRDLEQAVHSTRLEVRARMAAAAAVLA